MGLTQWYKTYPALEQAARAEPTSLQRRALAEARRRDNNGGNARDMTGSLAAWRRLVALHEGPVGRIRAIPERPEIHPAWAYAALAGDAQARGDEAEAESLYEKAAAVVEDYADTPPDYQMQEVAGALQTGVDLGARRRDLRELYARVTDARLALARRRRSGADAAQALQQRRAEVPGAAGQAH